jgi:hypothetical protein
MILKSKGHEEFIRDNVLLDLLSFCVVIISSNSNSWGAIFSQKN